MNIKSKIAFGITFLIAINACKNEDPFPKPKSYLRIDFPEHEYKKFDDFCNFSFEVSTLAKVINKPNAPKEQCFKNIIYPKYKATMYCTYVDLSPNPDSLLLMYTEYSRKLAYEHTIKASGIKETEYYNKDKKVYGTSFEIKGDVACNYLYYLTDSTNNYFASSLYFETPPNYDSLQPVLEYIIKDIEHQINTFEWK